MKRRLVTGRKRGFNAAKKNSGQVGFQPATPVAVATQKENLSLTPEPPHIATVLALPEDTPAKDNPYASMFEAFARTQEETAALTEEEQDKTRHYHQVLEWTEELVVRPFQEKIVKAIEDTSLDTLLSRKNPFLFAAKRHVTAEGLAKSMLDAHLSSSEETVVGNFLEALAIKISQETYGGIKAEEGKYNSVDLIFERDGKKYVVSIKSGPDWGNSSQVKKMKEDFVKARELLREEGWEGEIICVNGCAYGQSPEHLRVDDNIPGSDYYKFSGQTFWEFVSGRPNEHEAVLIALTKVTDRTQDEFEARRETAYKEKIKHLSAELKERYTAPNNPKYLDLMQILNTSSSRTDAHARAADQVKVRKKTS